MIQFLLWMQLNGKHDFDDGFFSEATVKKVGGQTTQTDAYGTKDHFKSHYGFQKKNGIRKAHTDVFKEHDDTVMHTDGIRGHGHVDKERLAYAFDEKNALHNKYSNSQERVSAADEVNDMVAAASIASMSSKNSDQGQLDYKISDGEVKNFDYLREQTSMTKGEARKALKKESLANQYMKANQEWEKRQERLRRKKKRHGKKRKSYRNRSDQRKMKKKRSRKGRNDSRRKNRSRRRNSLSGKRNSRSRRNDDARNSRSNYRNGNQSNYKGNSSYKDNSNSKRMEHDRSDKGNGEKMYNKRDKNYDADRGGNREFTEENKVYSDEEASVEDSYSENSFDEGYEDREENSRSQFMLDELKNSSKRSDQDRAQTRKWIAQKRSVHRMGLDGETKYTTSEADEVSKENDYMDGVENQRGYRKVDAESRQRKKYAQRRAAGSRRRRRGQQGLRRIHHGHQNLRRNQRSHNRRGLKGSFISRRRRGHNYYGKRGRGRSGRKKRKHVHLRHYM